MLGLKSLRSQSSKLCFIECRARKRQREALDPSSCPSGKCRDRAGVQPARKKQAHRNVGDEMRTHGILKKQTQLFSRCRKISRLAGIASSGRDCRVPPGPRAWHASPLRDVQEHPMPWWKGKYSFQKCHWLRDTPKKEISGDGVLRQVLGIGARAQQRRNLRRDGKSFGGLGVIEGFDTHGVAVREKNGRGG